MHTKEELKQIIRNSSFREEDRKMQEALLEFVESVPEVSEALLKAVSRIYGLYADMLDKTADILAEEARIDLQIAEKLERIEGTKPDEETKNFHDRIKSVANTMFIKARVKKSPGKPQ